MPPEGGGGGGGGVRQGGIDLLLLYRDTIQVLSAPHPPPPSSLSKSPFPPLKSVFSLISLIWEKKPDSLPHYPSLPAGLVSFPKPLSRSFLWSLIFGKPSSLHS